MEEVNKRVIFTELVEAEILIHQEPIWAAQRASGDGQHRIPNYDEIVDWPILAMMLKAVGFDTLSNDPWARLGCPRLEGQPPTEEMIDRRASIAMLLLGMSEAAGWKAEDVDQANHFGGRVVEARVECMEGLKEVIKERRKRRQEAPIPRWQEPSTDLFTFIQDRGAAGNNKYQLHLSNLLEFPRIRPEQVQECRATMDAIYKGHATTLAMLQGLKGSSLTIWAPQETNILSNLLATFHKHILQAPAAGALTLLIPYDPLPGCSTPQLILDLWSNPIFTGKQKGLIGKVEFLTTPTRCVFAGTFAPLHHVKSLVLVELNGSGASSPMAMVQWRPRVAELENARALTIDCDTSEELLVHKFLTRLPLPGLIRWAGPVRSPGSSAMKKRSVFVGFFPRTQVTNMDLRLIIEHMKMQDEMSGVLLGNRDLTGDPTAMVVEMGAPSAVEELHYLMDEVVLVSRRRAVMTTSRAAQDWVRCVTAQAGSDPTNAIEKIRYRSARNGGRPWIQPSVLEGEVRAGRTRAAAAKAPPRQAREMTKRATISVQGLIASNPNRLLALIMDKVVQVTKVQWEMKGETKQPNEFDPKKDIDGNWTGRIDVQADMDITIQTMLDELDGVGVTAEGLDYVMNVESAFKKRSMPAAQVNINRAEEVMGAAPQEGGGQ